MNSSVLFECVKNDSSLNDFREFKNILQVVGYSTAQEFHEAAIQKVIKACTMYKQFKAESKTEERQILEKLRINFTEIEVDEEGNYFPIPF